MHAASQRHEVVLLPPMQRSLLAYNCNLLLCEALNRRSAGIGWFAMLHADIEPEQFWLDKLIAEAEKHQAHLLSVVCPFKDFTGNTSTAISNPEREFGCLFRITQAQKNHPHFPETFDIQTAAEALERLPGELRVAQVPRQYLLVNTGCMVYRLSHWRPGIRFTEADDIVNVNGKETAVVRSEDWMFSKLVADAGGKVMATRIVALKHWGKTAFDSTGTWGNARDKYVFTGQSLGGGGE